MTVAVGNPVSTSMPVLSNTENVAGSVGGAALGYDACKSLETDPTTGLTYSYNYRGQLETVSSGSTVIRQCIYDCFGRMWFGSPRPLKWAVGGASAAGAGIASWMESED